MTVTWIVSALPIRSFKRANANLPPPGANGNLTPASFAFAALSSTSIFPAPGTAIANVTEPSASALRCDSVK
jgi:hypothetical protein